MSPQLLLLANEPVGCACSSATSVQVGPWTVPVGPLTVIFGAVAMVVAPSALLGWVTSRRRARAMRDVLAPDARIP